MVNEFFDSLDRLSFPARFPGHLVAGELLQCERGQVVKDVVNPSSGQILCSFRLDKNLIGQALTASEAAETTFRKQPFAERLALVERLRQALADYRDKIITCLKLGGGKPLWEAELEFDASLRFVDRLIACGESVYERSSSILGTLHADAKVELVPHGTMLVHIPFSVPCSSFVKFASLGLLTGSPAVMIASSHASLFAALMSLVVQELDFPRGVLSILSGNFETFRLAAQDRRVRSVMYRGSKEHCATIRKESFDLLGRTTILQSGGKNAVLVHPSAKVENAAAVALFGALKSAGQLCSSTSRAFVPSGMLKEFSDLIADKVRTMTIGPTDGPKDNPSMGPLYSQKSVDKFLRFQTMAKREAVQTVLWGKALRHERRGYFISPGVHIMPRVDPASAYQANVLLFPDLAIYEYNDLDTAVQGVNHTDAPLVVSIVAEDTSWIPEQRFASPNIMINAPTVEFEAHLPVSGRGPCGSVRHSGIGLIEELTYPTAFVRGEGNLRVVKDWFEHSPSDN